MPPSQVDIVIRARDCESDLRHLLPLLVRQTNISTRLIVVDNESRDQTQAVANEYGATGVPISHEDFSGGRALNRGLAKATSPFAIVLSADAWPTSDTWAAELVAACETRDCAVTYGRQIPRDDAPLDEWVRVNNRFPSTCHTWDDCREAFSVASNSCACIRVATWQQNPFDESALGAEELPWLQALSITGCRASYASTSTVEHSH